MFNLFCFGFYLTSRYAGRNVQAVVGSSLNFSWTFKGDSTLSTDFGFLIFPNAQQCGIKTSHFLMQLFDFVSYSSQDPPTMQIATASSLTSWVRQTVTLNVSKMVFLNTHSPGTNQMEMKYSESQIKKLQSRWQ